MALAVAVLLVSASATPAAATHNQWAHCNLIPNWYAEQYTNNLYTGIAGNIYTYEPFVAALTSEFSLTHLYAFRSGGIPETEVGWYRGSGTEKTATNSSYFTTLAETVQGYMEKDFQDAPGGAFVNYKIQNIGFDSATGKYKWGAFVAGDFTNPIWVWETALINWAQAKSGGEVTRNSGIQMQVRIAPSHQLLNPGDLQWHDWTDAYMQQVADTTFTCNDLGFYLSYNVRFDDYQVTGTGP